MLDFEGKPRSPVTDPASVEQATRKLIKIGSKETLRFASA